ncbi:MAG: hypothetical protein ACOYB0_10740 [Polynucleobacter sp.]
MLCRQACTACTQHWQERHQTQIKTGPASQILWQEAAVAYEAKAKHSKPKIDYRTMPTDNVDTTHVGSK